MHIQNFKLKAFKRIERFLKIREFTRKGIDPYKIEFNLRKAVSETAFNTAQQIRGIHRQPAIIIHGVMPRSGTVYVGELLRLHPDVYAYPNDIWEVPYLELTGDIIATQEHFFRLYKQNIDKIYQCDFLPLFGAAFIAYLHNFVQPEKRMLLKIPDVSFLNYFPIVFPYENLLLLLRDGRDVVSSTMKTWPKTNFKKICRRWDESARLMLEFDKHHKQEKIDYGFMKYEEIIEKPEYFIEKACSLYQLDVDKYPFDKIKELPARGSSSLQSKGTVKWEPMATPSSFKPIGSWKNWSNGQKKNFKNIAGRTLIETEYCDNLNW